MPIDFGKLGEANSADNLLSPREIFSVLPQKSKKYQYLRDVQAEVLNQWSDNRDKKDLVLKMNTGSGKTVVGLLILKSCLNESKSPSVYISPDPYLANQALDEAKDLGLEVTEDPKSLRFRRGNSILITTIKKLM